MIIEVKVAMLSRKYKRIEKFSTGWIAAMVKVLYLILLEFVY